MKVNADEKYLGSYILLTSVAVCLLVSPFNSVDATNLPKLCLLVVLSFISMGFILLKKEFFKAKENWPVLLMAGFFIFQLIIVFFMDQRDFSSKFYGTHGRNTGFAAYLSLTFLLIASTVTASKPLLKRYLTSIISCGAILSIYGIAQSTDHDFYQFYLGIGTKVFGTFGNSNFQSGFMGIVAAVTLSLLCFTRMKLLNKVILTIVMMLAIYNITLSSQQGYLNFLFGFLTTAIVYLFKSRKRVLGFLAISGSTIFGFLIILGIIDKGPLAALIYKASLQARGYYWRAAVEMVFNHPLIGVGLDGYGDWYRRARPGDYLSNNFFSVSDTAHNISLDLGASGGLPLFFAYLGLNILALISAVKMLRRTHEFEIYFTTIFAAWVAYQVQASISINQLGLGVWGWALSGLIIGYELNSRSEIATLNLNSPQSRNARRLKVSGSGLVFVLISTGAGFIISTPPYLAADKFYKALQSGDAEIIQPAAYLKPYDRERFLYVAQILARNKLEPRAIIVLRDASRIYPDSFEIWDTWAGLSAASPADILKAKSEMKRLDPKNPKLF